MTTPTTVQVRLQIRADTAANWASVNPILLTNELGLESDTKKFKIGNGSTAWNGLAYFPSIVSGGTVLGNLEIGTTGTLTFEGSTANNFETTLGVVDPTADRTILLPNQSGTVVIGGNASIVDADIAANAEIAVSKLADGAARQLLQTDAAGTGVEWTDNVDIPGTLDVTGAATFDAAVTVAGDLTVNGTTTTISTQNLLVEDKNIIIGDVATPTDTTADGGGITLKGATDKTINWVDSTDAWTSSERFSVPLGSASAPSLTFTGDPNTGIYSPGADQVAVATSGAGRLFIDSSGNIGIGVSSPGDRLHVVGPTAGISARFSDGVNATLAISHPSNGKTKVADYGGNYGFELASSSVNFLTAGSERMRLDSSGRLGVGTSAVGSYSTYGNKLVVYGTGTDGPGMTIATGATDTGSIYFANGTTGNQTYRGSVQYAHSVDALLFGVAASERMRLTSTGLGIGTASPGALLTLAASVPELRFVDSDNSLYGTITAPGGDIYIDADKGNGAGGSIIRFAIDDTERARIDSSGRLGIGTASPAGLLDVVGSNGRMFIADGTASNSMRLIAQNAAGNGNAAMVFQSHSIELGRFDSSGRLLIGTSSSPGSGMGALSRLVVQGYVGDANDGAIISLQRGEAASNMTAGESIGRISFNDNAGNAFAYVEAFADASGGSNDYPGRLSFSTTADGASSPTERMRIGQNGNFDMPGVYNNTTASAANVFVASGGSMARSTSSAKYKTDIETIQDAYADALLNCRPVWYRSTCEADNPNFSYWGFIAEEVAAIDPRLVHWKTLEITYDEKGSLVKTPCKPEPEGVAYDRFVPHLLNLIKRQGEAIADLQAEVAALKAQ